MVDHNFYRKTKNYSLSNLAKIFDCEYLGNGDFIIEDISTLDEAKNSDITFYNNHKYFKSLKRTKAGVVIVDKEIDLQLNTNFLLCKNPYQMMAKVAAKLYPDSVYPSFYQDECNKKTDFHKSTKVSSSAFVHKSANLGKDCEIGNNSIIGPNVIIGDNCLIGDNVSIHYSIIGNNVKIYQGVKIGSEGFGFIMEKDSILKIPQLGRVIIEENVERK